MEGQIDPTFEINGVQTNLEEDSCVQQRKLMESSITDGLDLLNIDVEVDTVPSFREDASCSKNVLRKQRNWERRLEAKKSKRKEEKQRRKLNRSERGDLEPEFSKRVVKAITRERLEEARAVGPRLCVDMSMTDCMSPKEISRLAGQIRRLYGSNRKAPQPFHLFLTNMTEDSLVYKECLRMNDGFLHYLIDVTEKSWLELFTLDDVIYLTPDANEALEQVEGDTVYILGGLVDESIQKKLSYTRAKELGVRMARLPIDEYMVKKSNPKNFHSKILAINQVFDILLMFRETGSWTQALSANIPPGKGYMVGLNAPL
ncbi:tRNA methyltransferase 10 homolog B isoform X3 [Chanos chanos]|uniref:tRNA methyltransferase 10 homolog B n=1 Tax=Chanos chanos TaxID=29144 RepID=A0A6J2VXF1_CHACN|nr:tRNA methyltransferase 10 homolog B isoform X3 [Chanos chanos]